MRRADNEKGACDRPSSFVQDVGDQLREVDRLAQLGELAEASRLIDGLLAGQPGRPEFLQRKARYGMQKGRPQEAIPALRSLLLQFPEVAALHNSLGAAYAGCSDHREAVACFDRACALAPPRADYWYNLARAHDAVGDAEAAKEACDKAIALVPDPETCTLRGNNLRILGQLGAAEADFRAALQLRPGLLAAWVGLLGLKSVRLDDAELELLGELYRQAAPGTSERTAWGFVCGQALEAAKRYSEAVPILVEANASKAALVRWQPAELSTFVDATVAGFSGAVGQASDASLGREVIFVVGMARSGSTLTEQILSAHPQVEGAGELPDVHAVLAGESERRGEDIPAWAAKATGDDWARLGREYLARTATWRRSKPMFTDKQLDNWRYVGAIRAMLPSARFVYCRRDPVETCWSCFKHSFLGSGAAYTYDFLHLAAYSADMSRLMRFWEQRHAGSIHEQVHETFLADPEAGTRTLLDHSRLPFDAACLRFDRSTRAVRTASAGQVRQPLRAAVKVCACYGPLLDPLRVALRDQGQASAGT
jgi:tetratricopeptide (TPR) repeat protein